MKIVFVGESKNSRTFKCTVAVVHPVWCNSQRGVWMDWDVFEASFVYYRIRTFNKSLFGIRNATQKTNLFIKNAAPRPTEKEWKAWRNAVSLTPPNVFPFSHPVDEGVIETLKQNIVTVVFTNLQKILQKEGKCRIIWRKWTHKKLFIGLL